MINENQVTEDNKAASCRRILKLQTTSHNLRERAIVVEEEAYELIRQLRHASAEDIVFDGSVYNLAFSGSGERMRKIRDIAVIQ